MTNENRRPPTGVTSIQRCYVRRAVTSRTIGLICAALLLTACGGGQPQDAQEPSGKFRVEITTASFPVSQRLSEHTAKSYHVWERARPANDFAAVRPLLETTVLLSRELAGFFPGYAHPYDALIDHAEDGMTVAAVRELFAELRAGLVPLIL